MNSFLKKFVTNNIFFGERWLPGSGRGDLGREAQATKVNSFLKNLLTTYIDLGRGGCLDLEGEIWEEGPRQQK